MTSTINEKKGLGAGAAPAVQVVTVNVPKAVIGVTVMSPGAPVAAAMMVATIEQELAVYAVIGVPS